MEELKKEGKEQSQHNSSTSKQKASSHGIKLLNKGSSKNVLGGQRAKEGSFVQQRQSMPMSSFVSDTSLKFDIPIPEIQQDTNLPNDQSHALLKRFEKLSSQKIDSFQQQEVSEFKNQIQLLAASIAKVQDQFQIIKPIGQAQKSEILPESELQSQNDALMKNKKYLEDKIVSILTEKEELVIKLKSEIVIYKNKIKQYKSKLSDSVKGFETKKIIEVKEALEQIIKDKEEAIYKLNESLILEQDTNRKHQEEIMNLKIKLDSTENEYCSIIEEKNKVISDLASQISGIDTEYLKKITDIRVERESTQKKLNLEEKERSINSIKLEYLLSNIKKLQLQKTFLEKALDRDMKKLDSELKRTQMDLQQDQYMSSQNSFQRIQKMHMIVKESLKYVKDVVGFMNFDTDEIGSQLYPQELKHLNRQENNEDHDDGNHEQITDKQEIDQKEVQTTQSSSIEQYFYRNIYEISEVVLSILSQLYKESRTQTSTDLIQLFDLLQSKTDKSKVQEIYNRFFASNRIHFAQYLNKMGEKCFDLENERNDLRLSNNKLRKELTELNQDWSGQEEMESNKRLSNIEEEESSIEKRSAMMHQENNNRSGKHHEYHKHLTAGNQITDLLNGDPDANTPPKNPGNSIEFKNAVLKDIYIGSRSPAAVKEVLNKGYDKKPTQMLQLENQALKDRVKEVRLTLSRQIHELQEEMKILKDQHLTEINQLKVEYGKDLKSFSKNSKMREDNLRSELTNKQQNEIEVFTKDNTAKVEELKSGFEQRIEVLQNSLEKTEMSRQEIDRKLRKLKKQSTMLHKGGWGTFSVVFEEGNTKNKQLHHQPKVPEQHVRKTSVSDFFDPKEDEQDEEKQGGDLAIHRINHFIEVGFLIDEKNYKHVEVYKEKTFDSHLSKYLYEFQDPVDNNRILALQNKIRSQLHENYALFNEINPIYVSLNMGRPVITFGDASLTQENFKLLKREGIHIGEADIVVNFMKAEIPPTHPMTIRIIAFENETYKQYSLDLEYEDMMIIVDGNMKLLEDEQSNELCQLLTNNLTMISKKGEKKGGKERVDTVMAVEHKIFFNESHRQEYDQRNKIILAKHDKRKKGLLQEKTLQTDFSQSVIYEAFDTVYYEDFDFSDKNRVSIDLQRGRMSENIVLKVRISPDIEQELALYSSRDSKSNNSQQISSEIVKIQNEEQDGVIAYMFSVEKIFNLEHLLIRVVSIEVTDKNQMTSYIWDPSGSPAPSATSFNSKSIYLVKKSNRVYQRMDEFELLNTEIRSLMFMHSYGFNLQKLDFGSLKAISDFNLKYPVQKVVYKDMALIYRNFGIIRVQSRPNKSKDDNSDEEGDNEEVSFTIENHYSLFSIYDNTSGASITDIFIQVKVFDLNIVINQQLNIEHFLPNKPFKINQQTCQEIIQKLILQKNSQDQFEIYIDKDIEPMKKVLEQVKIQKYLKQLERDDQIASEIDVKTYQIALNNLVDSPKITSVSIINRKIFKITAYFVSNQKNLKLHTNPLKQKSFEWQFIYIDAFSRKSQRSFYIIITEKDINDISEKIKEQQIELYKDLNIMQSKIKKEQLLEFVLDCIILDSQSNQLKLSTSHLRTRLSDRELAKKLFTQQGGRFINKIGVEDDPDLNQFQSSIPQIEMTRKLMLNIEKEFSDKTYDIKIYEMTIKSLRGSIKYQLEMFYVENPALVFRMDFYCENASHGKKILFERINIVQQLNQQDTEENKYAKDGLVISIIEQSFPHQVTFVILEPVSHILWSYTVKNDKLNLIESYHNKELFVKVLKKSLENNITRDISQENSQLITPGYQKVHKENSIEIWLGNMQDLQAPLIYAKNLQLPSSTQTLEVMLVLDNQVQTLNLIIQSQGQQKSQLQISFQKQIFREGSRLLQGFIKPFDKEAPLIYTVESACANTEQDRAFRIILTDSATQKCLLNVAFASKQLLDPQTFHVKDDMKYSFTTGFKDSLFLFQQLNEIYFDFGKAFIEPHKKQIAMHEEKTSKLLLRKVVSYQQQSFILSILYESEEKAEHEWKVILIETDSYQEEEFVFDLKQIMTHDEYSQVNVKNERVLKMLVASIADKRLKIKEIKQKEHLKDDAKKSKKKAPARYLVYFIDPNSLVNPAKKGKKENGNNFDIRECFKYSFINPDVLLPTSENNEQERVLCQLEKDDFIYDISEILNPYELILRIKSYDKDGFKMICISELREIEIKIELNKDQKQYLMEPQRREELSKYLIQNSHYDENKGRIQFLKSSL